MSNYKKSADAIRALSMDAVQKANSGHPGMPMGMADIATVLWQDFLQHNPLNPAWANRDRFVLSNGHGSMLQYALLHLTGYDLSIEDLKQFRQLHSRTPGHPEYGITPGVETTTGPLGQGFANAVGMAVAERSLAAHFNKPNLPLINHFTYVFVGDGCLMEGISHEVASLAGCLGLGKLIAFWDDNGISIDGSVAGWFKDNTPQRFEAYHWHVIANIDGHDPAQIKAAIEVAQSVTDKPSLLCCKTHIAFGAPTLQGTSTAHGAPLGAKEITATKQIMQWNHPAFVIPDDIYEHWNATKKGTALEEKWQKLWGDYQHHEPLLAEEFLRRIQGKLPEKWYHKAHQVILESAQASEAIATRKASLKVLNQFGPILPELLGGSADLTESNLTLWKGAQIFDHDHPQGNYIHYGVREFGMSAMMNGMALYGSFIPYGGTFLVFSDYARNAVRLAALMKQRVIFIYSHDSIGLGEDGPTHQPIEHIASLRLIPKLSLWRPCDQLETAVAWTQALKRNGPTCLLLTRQAVPALNHKKTDLNAVECGAYCIFDCPELPEIILIATGSEVHIAIQAAQILTQQGKLIRVVSMPSSDRFEEQTVDYQNNILPPQINKRVAIEAGSSNFWYRYVGKQGKIIGIDHFGESAPGSILFKHFEFTVEHIIKVVNKL